MKKNKQPRYILLVKGNFSQRQFDALGKIWDNLQNGKYTDWTLPVIQLSEKGSIEILKLPKLKKNKNKKHKG
jgi:hypothetical protein